MQSEFATRESQSKGNGVRRATRPTISIVLASSQSRAALDACVSTLTARCSGSRAELIVARADSALHLGVLSRLYPQARFVPAPAAASIGDLRTHGMRAATGDIVLLLDDGAAMDERYVDGVLGRFIGQSTQSSGEQTSDLSASNVRSQLRRESLRASGDS